MLNYFNLEDVKRELEKRIKEKEENIEEWSKVTFNYKKDGSEYQSIKKSINNCYYDSGVLGNYPELHVYTSGHKDYLTIFEYYSNIKDEEKGKYKIVDYMYNGEPYKVLLSIKEIAEKVKNHIKYLEDLKNEYKEILEYLEHYKVIKLLNELKEEFQILSCNNSKLYDVLWTIIKNI